MSGYNALLTANYVGHFPFYHHVMLCARSHYDQILLFVRQGLLVLLQYGSLLDQQAHQNTALGQDKPRMCVRRVPENYGTSANRKSSKLAPPVSLLLLLCFDVRYLFS